MSNDDKHNQTKIRFVGELSDFRHFWAEWPDNTRLEVIKSLIFTAPDMQGFLERVLKELQSSKFMDEID